MKLPVAPEGLPFIVGFALITILLGWGGRPWMGALPFLLTLFMVFFFRDPERVVPEGQGLFVAPADGEIVLVKRVREETYLTDEAIMVSIFMNAFNVHVNRSPVAGTVTKVVHHPGTFMNASREEASFENERIDMLLDTTHGPVLVRQVAGLLARRAVCRVKPGDELKTGERFGVIKFGSRVDLYLPKEAEVRVKLKDKTRAGETIIGLVGH